MRRNSQLEATNKKPYPKQQSDTDTNNEEKTLVRFHDETECIRNINNLISI